VAVSLLNTTAYQSVMDYIFAVIPLFVLMGILANLPGATRDLFSSAQGLFGRVRGGLGVATVVANAIFAAITGMSVASAAVFSKLGAIGISGDTSDNDEVCVIAGVESQGLVADTGDRR
jgi:C4-dicarboxylate transporter, DctM subunit